MKKISLNKIKEKNKEGIDKTKMKRKKKTKTETDSEDKVSKVKKKKKLSKIFYWILVCITIFCILAFLGFIGFAAYIVKSTPEFDLNRMFEKEATRVFDSDGNIFATLGTEQREKLTYDELPEVLIDSIIATEDSRFFQHNGFDAPRFLKASIQQVLTHSGGGASTLTMQLSKLSFNGVEDEGIEGIIRKFKDIYMAVFKIEKNLSKEQIIEYYVNTPCLGGNVYGVQQASQYYFGKDAKDLNLVEAAMIAGLFQSPNGYNPYYNPNDANSRKNTVLYLMKRHGYITEEEYKAGVNVKIKDLLAGNNKSSNEYQGFLDTVIQEIIDDTGDNPYDTPMDIYTTMRKDKQDIINDFYKTFKFRNDTMEAGIAAVDASNGALIAVGAGRNKTSALTLNVATFHGQTKRHPGSTIKPILDYGPAMEYANLSTYGPFIDEDTPYGNSTMRNFNGKHSGFMTTKECLVKSVNTCALQAFRMTTNEQKLSFMTSLGIEPEGDDKTLHESYSIGAFSSVSPVTLAGAYAAFASGGYYTKPYSYTKLVYRETEEEVKKDITRTRVMSEQTAYMISSILTGATSSSVRVSGTQIATKTGTSSYDETFLKKFKLRSNVIPDSWTSSYTKDYAIAIWIGYPEGLTSNAVKNKHYLIMSQANTDRIKIQAAIAKKFYEKNAKFTKPSGIVSADVEMETIPAQKPSAYTPDSLNKSFLFKTGTEPSEVSSRYSKLSDISNATYTLSGKTLNISFTALPTPSAIDPAYLTDYFNKGYSIWAQDYYQKRLDYNNKNIGTLGYEIYLTSGSSSVYVGWTDKTEYTIDLSKYSGIYDGFIIKSSYSIFKNNKSDGIKILFTMESDQIDESKISLNVNNQKISINQGETFNELNAKSITEIKYGETNITSMISNINIITGKITKKDDNTFSGAPKDITSSKGTYTIEYKVSFVYKEKTITKQILQTIEVK